MSVVMYDSVTLSEFPTSPQAVAGYVNGRFANFKEVSAKFPTAQHLSIAVSSDTDATCLDVEPGDATNAVAPGWLKRQIARGLRRPVLYTSASNVAPLETALVQAGLSRSQYLIWSAHFTFNPHICGPHTCNEAPQADATQWTDRAMGRNLDESLCSDEFFALHPPKPDTGQAHASVTAHLQRKTNIWQVHGTAGHAHFAGPDKWEEATIGVNLKTGKWRIHRKGK